MAAENNVEIIPPSSNHSLYLNVDVLKSCALFFLVGLVAGFMAAHHYRFRR